MLGLVHVAHRHLVAAPVAFAQFAVDLARARPALRRAQHDHRPLRPPNDAALPRICPDAPNVRHDGIERRRHLPGASSSAHGLRRSTARSRSPPATSRVHPSGCARGSTGSRSCSRSGAGSAARSRRSPGSGTCCRANRSRADRSRLRRRRRHRRRSGSDCRTLHRMRATARSQARRLRGSTQASPARRGSGCHPGS